MKYRSPSWWYRHGIGMCSLDMFTLTSSSRKEKYFVVHIRRRIVAWLFDYSLESALTWVLDRTYRKDCSRRSDSLRSGRCRCFVTNMLCSSRKDLLSCIRMWKKIKADILINRYRGRARSPRIQALIFSDNMWVTEASAAPPRSPVHLPQGLHLIYLLRSSYSFINSICLCIAWSSSIESKRISSL